MSNETSGGPDRGPAHHPGARVAPHVLRDYALIADGHRGALIGPGGEITWMCFPAWHDPAVFAGMLGSGGSYSICPAGRFVWGGYYETGSLIWRSRWITDTAIIECREALALPAARDRVVITRRIIGVEGDGEMELVLEPSANYGTRRAESWHHDGEARTCLLDEAVWRLTGAPGATFHRNGRVTATIPMREGEHHDLVLEVSLPAALPSELPDPDALWDATENSWCDVAPAACSGLVGERDVRHAFAVLHGLTSPTSGGTVAAATTSLPERADTNRSYDYRYVWIRDLCYIGAAGAALEAKGVVAPAVKFITARLLADGADLMPAYTVDGAPVPAQSRLDLAGYPGGADIIGNHVKDQFQLDAFGEVLLLFAAADALGALGSEGWRAAEIAAGAIEARWEEPDAGIWELPPAPWTHSRLICSAGLRAMAARPDAPAARWLVLADAINAEVARSAVHPTGRWQRATDDERVDAALLLPGIRGAVSATDPRHVATYHAVLDELVEDGYVYRFPQKPGQPLGDAEGAFVLCSFWMVLAALDQSDPVAAARWFERGRAGCGPPGLFAEEFDVAQRQLRGNLPQAFVHALLIQASVAQGTAEP